MKRLALLLSLLLLLPSLVLAAPATITITGKLLGPDGSAVTGKIVTSLSQPGMALDGATQQWVMGSKTATVGSDGTFTLALIPNASITPSGTAYNVKYYLTLADGSPWSWSESWQLAASPSSIDIGAITRVAPAGASVVYVAGPAGPAGSGSNPLNLALYFPDTMSNGETLARFIYPRSASYPSSCTGSYASAATVPTGTTVVTIKKNGTTVASVSVATSGTGTFTCASSFSFSAGDVLTVEGPATADATLAGLSITLAGTP